jgi:2-haloacid dehalogenase
MGNVAAKYDLILFDADDTLFDFAASQAVAFEACLTAHVGAGQHAAAYPIYVELSALLWAELERQVITKEELRDRRWAELAERCRFEYSVAAISASYLEELARQVHTIEGALDVCAALAATHQLGIVTNGFEAVQTARVRASVLARFFDFVVTSEAAGAAKPAAAPFERALLLAGRSIARERVLLVGDSVTSDIVGGQRMGFATCWFNPGGCAPPSFVEPDFTISRLDALLQIVR